MIFGLIGLVLVIYAFYNYKNALLMYLAYKLVLVTNITLISVPGMPLLTVEMLLTIIFIVLFFVKGKKVQNAHMKFPYRGLFLLLLLCWLISAAFAVAGFGAELSNLIKNISEEILLIWIVWEVVETKKDFQKVFQYITVVIFASCIYGLIEFLIQSNPLSLYESTLIDDETKSYVVDYKNTFRGYRINSIFSHTIGAGITWGLYLVFTAWLRINKKNPLKGFFSKLSVITAFLCLPCIIFTKMRSPILFVLIASISLFNLKKKRFYFILLIIVASIIIISPLLMNNSSILMSFFDAKAQNRVGGSTFELRIMQFRTAFELVKTSPIVGFGNKFMSVLPASSYELLYGLESIWLWVLVQYGIIGVVVYIVYFIYSTFIVPIKFACKPMIFISLAYWITYTTTSVPGFKVYLLFLVFIFFIKSSTLYNKKRAEGKVYGISFKGFKMKYGCIRKDNAR